MTTLVRGSASIGMQLSSIEPPATLPPPEQDTATIVKSLLNKLENMTTIVEGKADANKLKTLIAYSNEAIRIQAADIVLVGDVTIAQIIKDQNGTSNSLPVSITRIIGNKIRTGSIVSENWGTSAGTSFDLDAGILTIGGSSAPKLYFDGTNLTLTGSLTAGSIIAGSVTINSGVGESITSIQNNAQVGANISNALTVSGTTVLKGVIVPTDSGALKIGTISWNTATGVYSAGYGIAITEWGIVGANTSNQITFSLEASTGNALFKGDIVTGGQVYASGITTAGGYSACIIGNSGSGSITGIVGINSSNGVGIEASSTGAGGYAIVARGFSTARAAYLGGRVDFTDKITDGNITIESSVGITLASGTSLSITTGTVSLGSGAITTSYTSVVTNLNADKLDGHDSTYFQTAGDAISLGTNAITKTRVTGQLIHVYAPGGAEIAGSPFEYSFA